MLTKLTVKFHEILNFIVYDHHFAPCGKDATFKVVSYFLFLFLLYHIYHKKRIILLLQN